MRVAWRARCTADSLESELGGPEAAARDSAPALGHQGLGASPAPNTHQHVTPQSRAKAQWCQTLNERSTVSREDRLDMHAPECVCVILAPTRGRAKGRGRARTRASMSMSACQPHQPTREPRMMPATVGRPADAWRPQRHQSERVPPPRVPLRAASLVPPFVQVCPVSTLCERSRD